MEKTKLKHDFKASLAALAEGLVMLEEKKDHDPEMSNTILRLCKEKVKELQELTDKIVES